MNKSPHSPTSCSCHSVRFCISESPSGPEEEREQTMRREETEDGKRQFSGIKRLIRERQPHLRSIGKRPEERGSCHPQCRSGQRCRQSHLPHTVPGPLAHPLKLQELTFGCPSRRSLWNTWQNFQQSTALLERGSRLTTDQKVCAPFSWWVPSMHGEEGHGKQSTGPASGSQPILGVKLTIG